MKIIIKKLVVTERSLARAKKGEYTFWTEKGVRKAEVAGAVEESFGVKVVGVRSVQVPAKTRRKGKGKKMVKVREGKKMVVKLAAGNKIDLFSEFMEEKGK